MLIKKLGFLIFSLTLVSCTAKAPQAIVDIPKQWAVKDPLYKDSNVRLSCFPWWQQFKDPLLDELINEGLLYNNDIKMALANVEAAQGELKRVKLNWIPEVTGNAGYSSFPYLGFPGVLLNVVPSYTINIFRQIKEQKRAHYALLSSRAAQDSVRLAIIGQIVRSYLSYLAHVEQLALLKSLEQDLSRLAGITKSLYGGGVFQRIELENARTEVRLVQAQQKLVQQNIIVSQNSIRYLLDQNPGLLPQGRKFRELNSRQMVIGTLPLNMIEHRPDLEQARQELNAKNEKIGVALSELLPTIQLSMARGKIATESNGFHLGQSIHFNQAIVEVPLLRASALGSIEKTKGMNKAAFYLYINKLRKALRDVSNALSAHDLYTQRLSDVLKAERDLRVAYQLNNKLYQRGIISHLELIEIKVQLDKIAIEVNKHQLEQLISIVTLYEHLAAGYNYIPSRSVKVLSLQAK